jgi:hypothetical protein
MDPLAKFFKQNDWWRLRPLHELLERQLAVNEF